MISADKSTIRTRPAGKARSIGAGPRKRLVSTRTGGTKSATCTLEPIEIESERSIRSFNAAHYVAEIDTYAEDYLVILRHFGIG
jgi:hypothetical protein